jgi:hypothetical protein
MKRRLLRGSLLVATFLSAGCSSFSDSELRLWSLLVPLAVLLLLIFIDLRRPLEL